MPDSPPLDGSANDNGSANGNGANGHLTPPTSPRYSQSPSTPRRSVNGNGNSKILGSIDENGGMSPDIPIRSSRRPQPNGLTYATPRAFLNAFFPPPKNDIDAIIGPNGEKFSDVRSNRRSDSSGDESWPRKKKNILRRGGRKTIWCLGLVLIIIAALVAIGVVVGLKRMNTGDSNNSDTDSSSQDETMQLLTFPVGAYTISTYLLSALPSCTPNPSTWRCYPYTLYSASASASFSTLNWDVAGTNTSTGPEYTISGSDNIFTFPFMNATLTLSNVDTEDEHWGFSTTLAKVVFPDEVLSSDGRTVKCTYAQSMVSAKLYTRRNNTIGEKVDTDWPGAVEMWQTADQAPVCRTVVDGQEGEEVVLSGSTTGGMCRCVYADFE